MKSRPRSSSLNLVISSVAVKGRPWEKTGHFVISCLISNKNSSPVSSLALIDSGASAYGFIDSKFVRSHNLTLIPLRRPRTLKVFDGSESISGEILHMVKVELNIGGHLEIILLFVTTLAYFDIVLGLPWLQYHNPDIRWAEETIQFKDRNCVNHILNQSRVVHALSPNDVRLRREASTKNFDPINQAEICDPENFSKSVLQNKETIMAISIEDIEEALREKPKVDPSELLPKIYHEYLPVFSKDEADKLPPHRTSDHRIILKSGSEAPWGPLYSMSREELEVLKKYIRENLEKGFIRPSSSLASSPVLFVNKPEGGLRFCVDYRALNEITIKNRYPIPRIQETLSLLGKAKFFTKLDVISAFNRLRIAKGDEYLTAFRTRFATP